MESNFLIYIFLISLLKEFKVSESLICKYYPSGQSLNIGNNPLLTFGEDTVCPYSTQYCCTEKATTAADACCGPKFEWYFLTIPIIFIILIVLTVLIIILFCKISNLHKRQIRPENNYGKSKSSLGDDLSNSEMGQDISSSTFDLVNKDPVYQIETKTDTPVLVLPKKVHVLHRQATTQQLSRPSSQYFSRSQTSLRQTDA